MTMRDDQSVEWPDLLALLASFTSTPMGRVRALAVVPLSESAAVQAALEETTQARRALGEEIEPAWGTIADVTPILDRCSAEGSILDGIELGRLRPLLEASPALRQWAVRARELAPALAGIAARLPALDALRQAIGRALADDGSVRDDASPHLRRLRQRIRTLQARIVRELDALVQAPPTATLFADRYVTVRNGRYVVPLRADARSRLRGIVHDRSQSGQTLFVEPEGAVDLNNELIQEARAESAEVERVLRELTEAVRRELPAIRELARGVGELDWIFARARLAERMDGTCPAIDANRTVQLRAARHPLLLAQRWREPARDVVPVDLELSGERPVLVVTGPNAGGKTIALKTLGLLTLMTQVGCHLPVAPESRLPVVTRLHAIIGDDQSVAENLSTFSGFVARIRRVLGEVDGGSLVLLDELGAGTDPDEGAALAQAVLEELQERGALVMATTHLEPLKAFAGTHLGARNASVEFDRDRLLPTFRLVYDQPGPSYALAIAARLGLPTALIERAQQYRARDAAQVSDLVAALETRTRAAAAREEAIAEAEHEIAARLASATAELDRARERAQTLTETSRREATTLLDDLRRTVAAEWDRLRRAERSRRTLTEMRERLRQLSATLPAVSDTEALAETPSPGDAVEAVHLGVRGRLRAIAGDTATVQAGSVTVHVPLQALRKTTELREWPKSPRAPERWPEKGTVAPELLLLGRTADEARGVVEKYLDDAFLAGLPTARLVHGHGTGALRKAVHALLSDHPLVASFRIGEPHEGGSGATVVTIVGDRGRPAFGAAQRPGDVSGSEPSRRPRDAWGAGPSQRPRDEDSPGKKVE
jgi:DNA mismatch repair protein MutS2